MSAPSAPVEIPAIVDRLAAGRPVTPVWVNELGGVTFQIGCWDEDDPADHGDGREFVKCCPEHREFDLAREAEKLRWAGQYVAVPEVLGLHVGPLSWLHTRGLPGYNAVDPVWQADPATAVRGIAVGLRQLHDRLPVADCPYGWSVTERLTRAGLPVDHELARAAPPIDRLVVCQGDACAPNTLLDRAGQPVGHVDLGALGVADRWADLAVASYSLVWDYVGDWQQVFFDTYGVTADTERIAYYRRLWDGT